MICFRYLREALPYELPLILRGDEVPIGMKFGSHATECEFHVSRVCVGRKTQDKQSATAVRVHRL